MATIAGCPCGEIHEMRYDPRVLWERTEASMDATVPVTTSQGRYLVPRLAFACHGTDGAELALRCGFERLSLASS
jgi:hypothetical protein